MKKLLIISVIALLSVLISSCRVLTPFSNEIIKKEKLTMGLLKKVQFFSGEGKLVLERTITSEEKAITSGVIISKDGQEIEQVIFKKFTKGVLLSADSSALGLKLKIQFEATDENGEEYFLSFGPGKDGQFVLYSIKKKKSDDLQTYYGKNLYSVILEGEKSNLLYVNIKQIESLKITKRKAAGVSIDDNTTSTSDQ